MSKLKSTFRVFKDKIPITEREWRLLRAFLLRKKKFTAEFPKILIFHQKILFPLKVLFEILTVLNARNRTDAVVAPEMREPDQVF
jgi:hypothetical protein